MEHVPPTPFERFADLSRLSDAGTEIMLEPDAEQLQRLAQWAGVEKIGRFRAVVTLKRLSSTRFDYHAMLDAKIEQACVVTLAPVHSRIELSLDRQLHLDPRARTISTTPGGELAQGAGEDGVPEELDSPHFDVAEPVLEDFILAIDPYPRAPGVAFEPPADSEARPESPFAILSRLKRS